MSPYVRRVVVSSLFVLLPLAVSASSPPGEEPPSEGISPRRFVEHLDVRCYKIITRDDVLLHLDHLNPVFRESGMPAEDVDFDPQQLCVPVQKFDQRVPDDVLRYIQYVDWRCHGINGPSLDLPLRTTHLNKVMVEMFGGEGNDIVVREPQQLCVPVAKDDHFPKPEVLRLIEWLDVKCYRVDSKRQFDSRDIRLTHLNPLLADSEPEYTTILGPTPTQLCVPVAKNKAFPPEDVLQFIAYSDVLCYNLKGKALDREIKLTHLNPVLRERFPESEAVKVTDTEKFCVPVAKNGNFPPE